MQTIETKIGKMVVVIAKDKIVVELNGEIYEFESWKDVRIKNKLTTELLKQRKK